MLTKEEAYTLAEHWIAAWNAHDLGQIMAHYEDDVALISPVVAQLPGAPGGKVSGKMNLQAYFQKGLEAYPELQFDLKDILWGVEGVVLYYVNQKGTHTGEYMEISPRGKVSRVVANYSG
jgi:ketosteroid isomerase-like protein